MFIIQSGLVWVKFSCNNLTLAHQTHGSNRIELIAALPEAFHLHRKFKGAVKQFY